MDIDGDGLDTAVDGDGDGLEKDGDGEPNPSVTVFWILKNG